MMAQTRIKTRRREASNKLQYWLVGANWGGEDQFDKFIRRGNWEIGYKDEDQPSFAALRERMRQGDRVALKRGIGPGSPNIEVRALGVIKEVSVDGRVYINWLVVDLARKVPSKGCYKTIHGPFLFEDSWTREVFCL